MSVTDFKQRAHICQAYSGVDRFKCFYLGTTGDEATPVLDRGSPIGPSDSVFEVGQNCHDQECNKQLYVLLHKNGFFEPAFRVRSYGSGLDVYSWQQDEEVEKCLDADAFLRDFYGVTLPKIGAPTTPFKNLQVVVDLEGVSDPKKAVAEVRKVFNAETMREVKKNGVVVILRHPTAKQKKVLEAALHALAEKLLPIVQLDLPVSVQLGYNPDARSFGVYRQLTADFSDSQNLNLIGKRFFIFNATEKIALSVKKDGAEKSAEEILNNLRSRMSLELAVIQDDYERNKQDFLASWKKQNPNSNKMPNDFKIAVLLKLDDVDDAWRNSELPKLQKLIRKYAPELIVRIVHGAIDADLLEKVKNTHVADGLLQLEVPMASYLPFDEAYQEFDGAFPAWVVPYKQAGRALEASGELPDKHLAVGYKRIDEFIPAQAAEWCLSGADVNQCGALELYASVLQKKHIYAMARYLFPYSLAESDAPTKTSANDAEYWENNAPVLSAGGSNLLAKMRIFFEQPGQRYAAAQLPLLVQADISREQFSKGLRAIADLCDPQKLPRGAWCQSEREVRFDLKVQGE